MYLKEINEEIKNVVAEYAVMLYDRKEMHNILISDTEFTISDKWFLGVLLMEITETIAYATMKKRKTKEQEEQLEESIKHFFLF